MKTKVKKETTLFDVYRNQASKGFNYPTIEMCSDGDVITYLKSIASKKVSKLIKSKDCPLPLEVIPNQMGINLCSVESVSWNKQNDGQLTTLTIEFIPSENVD